MSRIKNIYELQVVRNEETEEECALFDILNSQVIIMGDYYHDKIEERIKGFIDGIEFCGDIVNLSEERLIDCDSDLFEFFGFNK